jgi:hypothetical protein
MDDDEQLTAAEQAALDAQRNAPEPEAPAQDALATPQEGAEIPEGEAGVEPPAIADKRQGDPAAALVQERERRREVERQAAEDRRKYEARFEELLKLVPQPAQQQAPEAPAIPDVQTDVVGHIVGTMQQLGASQQQIEREIVEQRQQRQQRQVVATIQQQAAAMETAYRAEHPEYDDAMQYLRDIRAQQLRALGVTDPARIAQQIQADAFDVAVVALREGANPAERLHRFAEASRWTPPAAGAPAEPAAAAVSDQAARLSMVQQGQQHARNLGGVRGNGPSPMTASKLLDMDDDAFLETLKKSKDARKLMGA